MRANTSSPKPSTDAPAPSQSVKRSVSCWRDSRTLAYSRTTTAIPNGTLIQNAQCHEKDEVSQPPRTGPTAAIEPIVEPHTAKAMPRSGPRKVALSSASVVGRIIEPPTPCRARAAMSHVPLGAKAHNTLATMNTTRPAASTRRRPSRSLVVPHTMSRAAKTSV